jgi:LysM repeat protein
MDHTAQRWPVLRRLCVTGPLLILLLFIPFPAHAQDGSLSEAGQAIAAAVNQARIDAGLHPLAVNALLTQAAQNHVNDMINNYVYGHYGSDGSNVRTRVIRTGYSNTPWVSENWVSSSSVAGAMNWWMNDYIHRVNILTGHWTEMGVGVGSRGSEMIFVTVFSASGGNGEATAVAAAAVEGQAAAPAPAQAPAQPLTVPPGGLDYTIQPGDTLMAVAFRYGIDWTEVAAVNKLVESSLLQIGQVIRLPDEAGATAVQAAPVVAAPPLETVPYTVAEGDTLFAIAARKGVTWQEVAAVNGFGENAVLQIGQEIKVPKKVIIAKPALASDEVVLAAAPPAGPPGVYDMLHTVGQGETVISIAEAHELDWQELLALNELAEDAILQPGQTLRLR